MQWRSFTRVFSCLYTFTIGSCRYFSKDSTVSKINECRRSDEHRHEPMIAMDTQIIRQNEEKYWKMQAQKADCIMKRRIRYHFTDHIHKWLDKERRRFPWKLIFHCLLVTLVTIQISLYAEEKFKVKSFLLENLKTFKKLFIKSECQRPVEELFTLQDMYTEIEHIAQTYNCISRQAVNTFYYTGGENSCNATNLTMSLEYINQCVKDESLCKDIDANLPVSTKVDLKYSDCPCDGTEIDQYSFENCSVINQVKEYVNFHTIDMIKIITFDIRLGAIYEKDVIEKYNSVQIHLNLAIILDNKAHANHIVIKIELDSTLKRVDDSCKSPFRYSTVLDMFVIIVLILTSITHMYSMYNTVLLAKDVKLHFLAYHKKQLTVKQISVLLNKWYILTLFTCLLLMVTVIMKITGDYMDTISISLIEAVSILFGIDIFLLFCGTFGFFRYFESLTVLFITLKLAFPYILRFAVCMIILFVAFMLCGWLVIGPYNKQFSDPFKAMTSLISILSGDGLQESFLLEDIMVSKAVSIFNTIYLIVFIFIFVYMVLSLFIGIFQHAYNSLAESWKERSRGFLWDWAAGEPKNDLTANYPFPVPHIRDLPSEFEFNCDTATNQTSLTVAEENSSDQSASNNQELSSGTSTTRLIHSESDSALFQSNIKRSNTNTMPLPYPKVAKSENPFYSSAYTGSQPVQLRHFSFVKSIVAVPPQADQAKVIKARSKLQSEKHTLHLSHDV